MKTLEIQELADFLDTTWEFETPLKIFEVEKIDSVYHVEATCFMRTFQVTWKEDVAGEELEDIKVNLHEGGFKEGRIKEEDRKIILS